MNWKQLHNTDENLKGLRQRLAVEATDGEQVVESADEDVRNLWVSIHEQSGLLFGLVGRDHRRTRRTWGTWSDVAR